MLSTSLKVLLLLSFLEALLNTPSQSKTKALISANLLAITLIGEQKTPPICVNRDSVWIMLGILIGNLGK
jgi:hypothetical protein